MRKDAKKILYQTLAMIAGWYLLWLFLFIEIHFSVIFFSVGLCFILPMHSVRIARLKKPC